MPEREGVQLRVLSYNVHSQRDDVTALSSLIRDVAPDVAIIQEGPRRLRWRQRCAALARSADLLVASGGLPAMGNLILTSLRVHATEAWAVRFPLMPGRHLRGSAFVRCRVGPARFVVAGSHLSVDPMERISQAGQLKRHLSTDGPPLVVGCDLNENSGGAAWRTVADGLVDAAVATGSQERGTFPSARPAQRIDAVFVDQRCEIVGYQVIEDDRARAASDHLPLVVDLVVPAADRSEAIDARGCPSSGGE